MKLVRIATRGSDLALAQANWVAARIRGALSRECEIVVIKTEGDRIQDVSLAKIGGKGLFVKEIEEALLLDRADVAVHSAKDLPAQLAPGLTLAAFPERTDPRDALVARDPAMRLDDLPKGSRIGTGSTRRSALLRAHRRDLEIVPLRGNVPTRLAKLESEALEGVIVACAGLERLGLADRISERISLDTMLPAVCQGTLALQTRADDALAGELAAIDDPAAALSVAAERSFLRRLEGDCTIPVAVHLEARPGAVIRVRGLVASLDGERVIRAEEEGVARDAEAIGRRLAESVLSMGGAEILEELRNDD